MVVVVVTGSSSFGTSNNVGEGGSRGQSGVERDDRSPGGSAADILLCVCVCVCVCMASTPPGTCRGGVQCHNTDFWNTVATEVHGTYAGGVVTLCGL